MIEWDVIPEFGRKEFDDPDHPGSGDQFDKETYNRLLTMRRQTGWPIITHAPVGGAVDLYGNHGHTANSYHSAGKGFKALDFHFKTSAGTRKQYQAVCDAGFTGIGIYYDWHWAGKPLPIGFHIDTRPMEKAQRWRREKGQYLYLLK